MPQGVTPGRVLYDVPETMALLNLSRTQLYELIRSRRLVTVTVGRRRLVPRAAIDDYVAELMRAAGGDGGRAA
ncbi:helix-turn-helix domain-containing protein [uncultured Cellulomonas sp.]|uniref:helix-turn-helix domain-containing protein n=1 Tax=uncultured Cellulomonas sp. TaxID=189682 RepID=UPI00262D227B|nr:helix-turn-helix domain-containing protein [uncultured Cellulomonas sp.]